MSSSKSMEEYYQKVIQLQEKLRRSEEERLKLEMKYNEMIQSIKEEEETHLKKIRLKYKQFLEEDRRRQQRNDKILDALDRIENRSVMWEAKTKKFKTFRNRFQNYLKPDDPSDDYGGAINNYLQSVSSKKSAVKPEDRYFNLGNINSIYSKTARDAEKNNEQNYDSSKTSKDFQNSLKQNIKPIVKTDSWQSQQDFVRSESRENLSEIVHDELKQLLDQDKKLAQSQNRESNLFNDTVTTELDADLTQRGNINQTEDHSETPNLSTHENSHQCGDGVKMANYNRLGRTAPTQRQQGAINVTYSKDKNVNFNRGAAYQPQEQQECSEDEVLSISQPIDPPYEVPLEDTYALQGQCNNEPCRSGVRSTKYAPVENAPQFPKCRSLLSVTTSQTSDNTSVCPDNVYINQDNLPPFPEFRFTNNKIQNSDRQQVCDYVPQNRTQRVTDRRPQYANNALQNSDQGWQVEDCGKQICDGAPRNRAQTPENRLQNQPRVADRRPQYTNDALQNLDQGWQVQDCGKQICDRAPRNRARTPENRLQKQPSVTGWQGEDYGMEICDEAPQNRSIPTDNRPQYVNDGLQSPDKAWQVDRRPQICGGVPQSRPRTPESRPQQDCDFVPQNRARSPENRPQQDFDFVPQNRARSPENRPQQDCDFVPQNRARSPENRLQNKPRVTDRRPQHVNDALQYSNEGWQGEDYGTEICDQVPQNRSQHVNDALQNSNKAWHVDHRRQICDGVPQSRPQTPENRLQNKPRVEDRRSQICDDAFEVPQYRSPSPKHRVAKRTNEVCPVEDCRTQICDDGSRISDKSSVSECKSQIMLKSENVKFKGDNRSCLKTGVKLQDNQDCQSVDYGDSGGQYGEYDCSNEGDQQYDDPSCEPTPQPCMTEYDCDGMPIQEYDCEGFQQYNQQNYAEEEYCVQPDDYSQYEETAQAAPAYDETEQYQYYDNPVQYDQNAQLQDEQNAQCAPYKEGAQYGASEPYTEGVQYDIQYGGNVAYQEGAQYGGNVPYQENVEYAAQEECDKSGLQSHGSDTSQPASVCSQEKGKKKKKTKKIKKSGKKSGSESAPSGGE